MAEPLVAVLDLVGMLGFLAAVFYGYRNWQDTRSLSEYWAVFTVASGIGVVWAAALSLEKLGFHPALIDQEIGVLLAAMATAFAISALLTATATVGPSE